PPHTACLRSLSSPSSSSSAPGRRTRSRRSTDGCFDTRAGRNDPPHGCPGAAALAGGCRDGTGWYGYPGRAEVVSGTSIPGKPAGLDHPDPGLGDHRTRHVPGGLRRPDELQGRWAVTERNDAVPSRVHARSLPAAFVRTIELLALGGELPHHGADGRRRPGGLRDVRRLRLLAHAIPGPEARHPFPARDPDAADQHAGCRVLPHARRCWPDEHPNRYHPDPWIRRLGIGRLADEELHRLDPQGPR